MVGKPTLRSIPHFKLVHYDRSGNGNIEAFDARLHLYGHHFIA